MEAMYLPGSRTPTPETIEALVDASPNITAELVERLQKVAQQCEHILSTDQGVNETGLAWVRTILRTCRNEDWDDA